MERFQALNALIGLPGYDTKIGAMVFGTLDPAKQFKFYLKGGEAEGGIEPLLRLEYTTLAADHPAEGAPDQADGATLMSATLRVNYWLNQWTRWQLNLIEETTSKKGNAAFAAADDGRFLPTFFAQFRIKF